jgi:hypothetical protein
MYMMDNFVQAAATDIATNFKLPALDNSKKKRLRE